MCVAALGVIGGLVSAAGSIYSGMAQSAGYKAQAKAHEYEAQAQAETGSYESARQDERNRRLTGEQIAAIASTGAGLSGSPLDVIADSRVEGELDKQAIRYGAQYKSNLSTYQSKIDKMNAKQAAAGGVIGALAPVINSFTGPRTGFA